MKEESYKDKIRVFHISNGLEKGKQKRYIRIELPDDSSFSVNEYVNITIQNDETREYESSVTCSLAPYSLIRMMSVGDTITLPKSKWNSARTSASKIKKIFGSVYNVRKRGDDVIVTRIR